MKTTDAYVDLRKIGRPVITTGEAAARLKISSPYASKRLAEMAKSGLIQRIRHGLWTLEPNPEPFTLAPYLTAPDPAYVSMFSALARHDMIEQIPRQIFIISLDRARRIVTSIGVFAVHQMAPELFGGFAGTLEHGYIARPEKALFDTIYVRSAAGSTAYFPELSLPAGFDSDWLGEWVDRIASDRLRTMVTRRIEQVLDQAD